MEATAVEKLVWAVEKRSSLWHQRYRRFPKQMKPFWEDVAYEVHRNREAGEQCREEWEALRERYVKFMDYLDGNIYRKAENYDDGGMLLPLSLEFLHSKSSLPTILEEFIENEEEIEDIEDSHEFEHHEEYFFDENLYEMEHGISYIENEVVLEYDNNSETRYQSNDFEGICDILSLEGSENNYSNNSELQNISEEFMEGEPDNARPEVKDTDESVHVLMMREVEELFRMMRETSGESNFEAPDETDTSEYDSVNDTDSEFTYQRVNRCLFPVPLPTLQ